MTLPRVVLTLAGLSLLGIPAGGARQPLPRLQVIASPDAQVVTHFRLTTIGGAVRIAGTSVLTAGRDTALATPVELVPEPGTTVTLETVGTASLGVALLTDSMFVRPVTMALGPRVRLSRDVGGGFRVLEARDSAHATLRGRVF